MAYLRDRRAFGNIGTRKFRGARFGDPLSPRFSGLLDQYGGAAAAYSLRALSSGWLAGDVVEVRRDVDGGGDIHKDFTASDITSGAMLTWVTEFSGTANGLVSKWYDQSGNDNNATQGSTTMQPKIVSTGALVVGGLDFDGVDDLLSTASLLDNLSAITAFSVANFDGTGTADRLWGSKETGRSDDNISLLFLTNAMAFKLDNGTSSIANSSVQASGVDFLSYINYDGATLSSAVDGGTSGTTARASFVTNCDAFEIGLVSSTGSTAWDGRVAEIIIYASDQSANRAAIETNINAAYSIF